MQRMLLLSTLASSMLFSLTGCGSFSLISKEQEIAMGREAAPKFEEEFGGPVEDAALQNYVSQVGQQMAAVSTRQGIPYEFGLLNSDVPNAFALPGGKIYITAGLLRAMTNERQLAGVLGHEVGHVAEKHSVEQIEKQVGAAVLLEIAATVIGGDTGEKAKAAGTIAANMAMLKYSREDEYEADKRGIDYTYRAGVNPYGVVELLEVLYKMNEQEPGSLGEMFQTHPLTSKRIEEAIAYIEEEYDSAKPDAPDPNAARFRNMQKRLK
ncbi:MAG: M48 family metalloprotease [Planctomycetes bacterium]|jgi:predicted Zn-dependent protease|nr:M48 family metalloprotease [Phycisphaerae bacterium]NBB96006.1 M48 family metalloprotease [Planctomycetota bacterium]